MAPSTKLALARSLKKLLQKKFLDDITVKEIVEDCEVNRQTFYYHFQDIYDLLRWFLEHETTEALKNAGSWRASLLAAFRYLQENQVMVYHVFRSSARDHLDCHFFNLARALIEAPLGACAAFPSLAEKDRAFLLDFYMYALAGTFMGWLSEDMKDDPEELVDQVVRLMDGEFDRIAEHFSAPPSHRL